jgi:ethanolamine utilization cobalamin adenosyltransferase
VKYLKVITEMDLRDIYRKEPFETYTVIFPEKLTPAAFQFLTDRRIKIIELKDKSENIQHLNNEKLNVQKTKVVPIILKEPEKGFILMDSGVVVQQKPEAYTHLKGKKLVPKNDKRIKFRGEIDSLEASFINTIVEVQGSGYKELVEDLSSIFEYVKKIMRAEVLNETLEFIDFKGWSEEDVREYSHYPDKYFGVKHFIPDPKYGKIIAVINLLRTQVRRAETAGVDAFYDEDKKAVEREDIIVAMNRMSSLIYIIMCQYLGGVYKL